MKIFIVGSGKLAKAILNSKQLSNTFEVSGWRPEFQALSEKVIIVHAGSGRQLEKCFKFCTKTNSVLIELSTGLKTEKLNPDFPLIICPNISVLVLKALEIIEYSGKHFNNYKISITESHQSSKITKPGTAVTFAELLNVPVEEVDSIRNTENQKNNLMIPEKYLNKHAYHQIKIKNGFEELTIETKVLGHQPYVNGLIKLIKAIVKLKLKNKKYMVWDFIENL